MNTRHEARPGSCLHLLAGGGRAAFEECRPFCSPGDTVLFLDAGVLHLLGDAPGDLVDAGVASAFVAADLAAQGLARAAAEEGVQVVDDAALAELLRRHVHCLTWT